MSSKVYNRDIFISYRRKNGGEGWANTLKLELEKYKLNMFLDKHDEMSGDFKETILNNIKHSNNFVLILTKGILEKREGEDIFREEIKYAKKCGKNIVPISFSNYDLSDVDWDTEDEELQFLRYLEFFPFVNETLDLKNASIKKILTELIGQDGKPWKNEAKDNSNWYDENITEEDKLWMYASNDVCRKLDKKGLKIIIKKLNYNFNSKINLFTLMAYDIEDLYKRISFNSGFNVNVYGFCHSYDIEKAKKLFGENHFLVGRKEEFIIEDFMKLLEINNIKYYDIVDFELVLKDLSKPASFMRYVKKYLNPNGAACYIRDLDDDFVSAYPDNEKIVEKMVNLLTLDPGAGFRHFGKQIYDFMQKTGAQDIKMLDNLVTNLTVSDRLRALDAYFSYLVPEFRELTQNNPNNEAFIDALKWLEENYETKVKNLFSTKEFYCRLGFVAGVGIYRAEEDFDFDDEDDV